MRLRVGGRFRGDGPTWWTVTKLTRAYAYIVQSNGVACKVKRDRLERWRPAWPT